MVGSTRVFLTAFSRARVLSSSAPIRRLYPATSAANIAASRRSIRFPVKTAPQHWTFGPVHQSMLGCRPARAISGGHRREWGAPCPRRLASTAGISVSAPGRLLRRSRSRITRARPVKPDSVIASDAGLGMRQSKDLHSVGECVSFPNRARSSSGRDRLELKHLAGGVAANRRCAGSSLAC